MRGCGHAATYSEPRQDNIVQQHQQLHLRMAVGRQTATGVKMKLEKNANGRQMQLPTDTVQKTCAEHSLQ
jgi:hypothetical protein